MSRQSVLVQASAILLAACGPTRLHVPGVLSPVPRPSTESSLQAGFGRVDITPPPGVGLAGNGPEGGEALGYRLRLYARVLVLADGDGNRVALVVADSAALAQDASEEIAVEYRELPAAVGFEAAEYVGPAAVAAHGAAQGAIAIGEAADDFDVEPGALGGALGRAREQ